MEVVELPGAEFFVAAQYHKYHSRQAMLKNFYSALVIAVESAKYYRTSGIATVLLFPFMLK